MNKAIARLMGVAPLLCAAGAQAQGFGANEGQISSFLSSSANWLVGVLGPGVFIIGIIIVGISLAMGNEDATRRGGYVIAGGALIFLARPVVALFQRLAGG